MGILPEPKPLLTCGFTEPTPGLEPGTPCLQEQSDHCYSVHTVRSVLTILHWVAPEAWFAQAFVTNL